MIKFEDGVAKETTSDDSCALSFNQIKGMIDTGQWIELIREFLRSSNIGISDMFDDILFVEDNFDIIQIMFTEIPAITSIKKDVYISEDIPLICLCDKEGFVEKNWECIASKYYEKNMIDGNIIYMFTLADGETAVKCIGFY